FRSIACKHIRATRPRAHRPGARRRHFAESTMIRPAIPGALVAIATALSAAMPQTTHAQGRSADATSVVVRAARMLDVTTGEMRRNATVVVTGDRITAVNPSSPPAGARVIDLGDVTLLPGFIDAHTHLGGEINANSFIEPVRETNVDAAF